MSQATGGVTTRYTQDLAAPLSQVLQTQIGAATRTDYLYGLNRLASLNGSTKTWYAADALGSVRRTVTDAGVPLGVINYDPWGTPESGTVPTFGFTGEVQDVGAGLVNLRARWYSTARGRFTSVDPFAGVAETPYSLHQYAYGLSDPMLMTDPSGRAASIGDSSGDTSPSNPRDLTDWLYREMKHNLDDPRLQDIRNLNNTPFAPTCVVKSIGSIPIVITAGLPGPLAWELAGLGFYGLVRDRAQWDFKHKILERLGFGITLYSNSRCKHDTNYSVPGNIHFGFVAGEAGYGSIKTRAGAGVAEIFDPAHFKDKTDPDYRPQVGEFPFSYGPNGWEINLGDAPADNRAVLFGIRLYQQYGRSLTYATFRQELDKELAGFETSPPNPKPVEEPYASKWPYPISYFDPTR